LVISLLRLPYPVAVLLQNQPALNFRITARLDDTKIALCYIASDE